MSDLVYSINKSVISSGSLGIGEVKDESKIRIVIEGATSSNVVRVRGRIIGQSDWDTIVDIVGDAKQVVKVMTYDQIEVLVTVYSSVSNNIKVIATSFNEAGGSTSIGAPAGGTLDSDEYTFTSSDNSISITADPLTNSLDFTSTGVGGLSKYSQVFVTTDWVLNGNSYELTILSTVYGNKPNPIIHTYETILGEDTIVVPSVNRNINNDIILQVSQVPDNRYNGKVIIL